MRFKHYQADIKMLINMFWTFQEIPTCLHATEHWIYTCTKLCLNMTFHIDNFFEGKMSIPQAICRDFPILISRYSPFIRVGSKAMSSEIICDVFQGKFKRIPREFYSK